MQDIRLQEKIWSIKFPMGEVNHIQPVAYVDCLTQSNKDELDILIKESSPDILGITKIFPKRSSFQNPEIFNQLESYAMFFNDIEKSLSIY